MSNYEHRFYGENNVITDMAVVIQARKGYIKPLFIKDAVPKIIRAWTYDGNVVKLA